MRISDWSSDVCSSDLCLVGHLEADPRGDEQEAPKRCARTGDMTDQLVERVVAADIFEDGEDSACGIVPGGGMDRAGRAIERLVITQRRPCGEDCAGCGVGARRRWGPGTHDLFAPGDPAPPATRRPSRSERECTVG